MVMRQLEMGDGMYWIVQGQLEILDHQVHAESGFAAKSEGRLRVGSRKCSASTLRGVLTDESKAMCLSGPPRPRLAAAFACGLPRRG